MVTFVFVFSFWLTATVSSNEEFFCKSRPGCHIAQCDPSPPALFLTSHEYPITCVRSVEQDKNNSQENLYEAVDSQLKNATQSLTDLTSESLCKEEGGLVNAAKCYFIRSSPYASRAMNYNQAVAECENHGGTLAEIHGIAQQETIQKFRSHELFRFRSYAYLWVGMEYDHKTSSLLYKSGERIQANRLLWDSGYPTVVAKHLSLEVGNDGDSFVGLQNILPTRLLSGVVCETNLRRL